VRLMAKRNFAISTPVPVSRKPRRTVSAFTICVRRPSKALGGHQSIRVVALAYAEGKIKLDRPRKMAGR
jgi:hypothetical protein